MRRIGRPVTRRHYIERHRPQPAWLIRLRTAARMLLLPVLLVVGLVAVERLGMMASLHQQVSAWAVKTAGNNGFVISRVEISGEERTDPNILRSVLARHTGSIILSVDKVVLKKELERLPWVRSATVRTMIPDALVVRIEEHQPFAWWRHGDAVDLVSDRGEVIDLPAHRVVRHKLPIIAGNGAPQRAPQLFHRLAKQPNLYKRLTAAHFVRERRWNVYVDGRTEINLPGERIDDAWRRLAERESADQLLDRAISAIDLRNRDWIILELDDAIVAGSVREKA